MQKYISVARIGKVNICSPWKNVKFIFNSCDMCSR